MLGHLSFRTLKLMAKAGLVPRELANVPPPICPGCAYGKAHRKPWRSKGAQNKRSIRTALSPGEVLSINQLVSPTPGFVPTHQGRPTTARYNGATVFIDHFSDFVYVCLMSKMDADSTVHAKAAFERVSAAHGITVKHYHADNGLFDTKALHHSIQNSNQTISFCGVNAHHQNGKAESAIKDVTQGARVALLHAAHHWPKATDAALWPSALKNFVNQRNSIPRDYILETIGTQNGKWRRIASSQFINSPLSKYSGCKVEPNLTHFHPLLIFTPLAAQSMF